MTIANRFRPLLLVTVVAGLGLSVAACNGGNSAQSPEPETVTVAPEETTSEADAGDDSAATGTEAKDSGGGPAGAQLPASWPDEKFPVPPGVTVAEAQDSDEIGIVLSGVDPAEVAAFYRNALPAAGYQITDDDSVGVGGVSVVGIEFVGNGYNGKLAVVNQTVAISLEEQ